MFHDFCGLSSVMWVSIAQICSVTVVVHVQTDDFQQCLVTLPAVSSLIPFHLTYSLAKLQALSNTLVLMNDSMTLDQLDYSQMHTDKLTYAFLDASEMPLSTTILFDVHRNIYCFEYIQWKSTKIYY